MYLYDLNSTIILVTCTYIVPGSAVLLYLYLRHKSLGVQLQYKGLRVDGVLTGQPAFTLKYKIWWDFILKYNPFHMSLPSFSVYNNNKKLHFIY